MSNTLITPNKLIKRYRNPHYKKRHLIVQNTGKYVDMKLHNHNMDQAFMRLLKCVKKLYKGSNEFAFERDLRTDTSLNLTTMHYFQTKDAYLELTCDYVEFKCYVHYDFGNCPFEPEIRKMLSEYPFSCHALHTPLKDGTAVSFTRVKAYQAPKYFYKL